MLTLLCAYPFYYIIINLLSANDLSAVGFATAVIDDMQCLEYGCMPYGKLALGIMVGSKTKQPERVARFIDWLYSPEGVEINKIYVFI